MSHEITASDIVVAHGNTWHGLHVPKQELMLLSEAFSESLGFSVVAVPLTLGNGRETDRVALCADSADGRILGYASNGYAIWQNEQQQDVCQKLVDKGRVPERCVSSAGSVRGQRKCFVSLDVGAGFEAPFLNGRIDNMSTFLNFLWGHDGLNPWGCSYTTIRTVCKNTFDANFAKAFNVKHTANMGERIQLAIGAVDNVPAYASMVRTQAERLAGRKLEGPDELRDWTGRAAIADILGMVAPLSRWDLSLEDLVDETIRGGTATRDGADRRFERYRETAGTMRHLAQSGRGNTGETFWDVFNGVTDYIDHSRAMRGDAKDSRRADYSRFGFGRELKSELLDTMVASA